MSINGTSPPDPETTVSGLGAVGELAYDGMSDEGLVAMVVVGASLMGIATLVVMVMAVKKCCVETKDPLLHMDEYGCCVTKSAPSTRQSSPRHMAADDIGGARGKRKLMLMRSLTADMIPDTHLPAERVQPLDNSITTPVKADHGPLSPVSPKVTGEKCYTGQLWFSLCYNTLLEELTVNLIKAKGLPPRNNNSRNPYVNVYLLPDDSKSYESKIKKKTLDPRFEEKFVFKVYNDEIEDSELRLSVYDLDSRRTRHSLGYVCVPLGDMELSAEIVLCKDLITDSDHG